MSSAGDIDRAVVLLRYGARTMRAVRNWYEAVPYYYTTILLSTILLHTVRHKTIDLHFRRSLSFSRVEPSTAWTLITYYYHAHSMRIFSDDDLSVLFGISSDVQSKLSSVFTEEEITNCSPGIDLGSNKEALLFCLIRRFRPSVVVETGVAQGRSSYFILKALELNGHGSLVSIDLPLRNPRGCRDADGTCDPTYIPEDLDSGWLVPHYLRRFWTLRLGKSSEVLPTINAKVDLFFHDSEHTYRNMKFEYEWAYAHLSTGGIIASDDVRRNRAWIEFLSHHTDLQWCFKGELLAIAAKRS
jgi:hypothetical protein